MYELIITQIAPETKFDPPYTKVYRFEFDDVRTIEASLAWLRSQAIAGGQMSNMEE